METKARLLKLLRERKYKITFAESCTGGALASEFVCTQGASDVFEYGFITYSKNSKINLLGVDIKTINDHGIVSTETAEAMVLGAVNKSKADVGISVTGCAGPGKDSEGNDAGTVCFAFYVQGKITKKKVFFSELKRNEVREKAVDYAFENICLLLENN